MTLDQGASTPVDDAQPLGSVIRASDMRFHPPRFRDFRWLETNAFTFTIPEAKIGCHIWNGFRVNVGVVESNIKVFNSENPHAGPIELLYDDAWHHIPLPPHQLHDFSLANGLRVRMTKPLMEWELFYEGADDTVFDLHLRGLCPPLHISETGTEAAALGSIKLGHLDQMMAITGTVRVNGTQYDVDFPSWRDHSWSPRPEGAGRSGYAVDVSANFDYGAFGNDYTFFVQTTNRWESIERGVVDHGYITVGADVLRLKQGEGRFVYDERWTTRALEYELEDERGRTHVFTGEAVSFHTMGPTVLAVVKWTTPSGEVGWGQYDWHGDVRHQRAQRPPGA
jgi:hypothetical protein